jgi:His/Glu/Gln/Arg/opine family amino acid ABC transporter permease subunit
VKFPNFIPALTLYIHRLPAALLVTINITLAASAIGIFLGLLLALAALSHIKALSRISLLVITIFRSIPIPPFLYLAYFFILIYVYPIVPAQAGTLALGILLAPYMAELFRSGLQSVDKGQVEVGQALGMSASTVQRRIVIPQAIQIMLPAIGQLVVGTLLNSAFVAVLGGKDVTGMSRLIIDSTFTTELYIVVALTYFMIAYPLSRGLSYLERRWKLHR